MMSVSGNQRQNLLLSAAQAGAAPVYYIGAAVDETTIRTIPILHGRSADTEAKIISFVSSQLNNQLSHLNQGPVTLNIYSGLQACESCSAVMYRFSNQYKIPGRPGSSADDMGTRMQVNYHRYPSRQERRQ